MTRLGVAAAIVDGALVPGDVAVVDGRVAEVGLPPGRRGLAVPGLVDLQVNGYAGVDFLSADVEAWSGAAAAMARDGVTAYVANLITSPESLTQQGLLTAAKVQAEGSGARLLGAHLEGPFLAPAKAGTHPKAHLRTPDVALVQRLLAAGPVVGITVAPELPGALELIASLRRQGILVSLGHSEATAEQANAGFDGGATTVTHIFNAMNTPTARAAGLAGVALGRQDIAVQLICDGVHLSEDVARLVVTCAPGRFVLVTDALAAAGAPEGDYLLGEVPISSHGGSARRSDGTLAGSVLTMLGALKNVVAAGASVEYAVAAATTRPAALLGRHDLGRLQPGDPADIVVLDDSLDLLQTYRAGVPTI